MIIARSDIGVDEVYSASEEEWYVRMPMMSDGREADTEQVRSYLRR